MSIEAAEPQHGPGRVSLICTVLNEGESIRRLMDSVVAQTRPPDEVVIVDGGSRDNTVEVLREYAGRLPLHIFVEPGANISRGRNVAIGAAAGAIIASTDAGVWLEPRWLESLVAGFEEPGTGAGRPQWAAGFFVLDAHSVFEMAMGATVLPAPKDVNAAVFLPSSRSVAFTKEAWAAAGGYPEWLDYCEDLIFDLRLRDRAGPFAWAPDAIAHFRPRRSLGAFFRQYYRYARGDGKADLWRARHAIRYVTYLVLLPGFLALSIWQHPLWLLALLAGTLVYCRSPYRRLGRYVVTLSAVDRLRAVLWVPTIRAAGDIAKMLGYPAGWAWRLRHWADPQIHWR